MSEVTIEWTQNVAGKHVGYVERVERTPFVDGCIKQLRAKVIEEHVVEPVVEEKSEIYSFPTDAPGAILAEAAEAETVRRSRPRKDEPEAE